jgi:hypothetical protein
MKEEQGNKTGSEWLAEIAGSVKELVKIERHHYRVAALNSPYYTSEEMQKILGVTAKTLGRWRKKNLVIWIKKGKIILYPKKQLDTE